MTSIMRGLAASLLLVGCSGAAPSVTPPPERAIPLLVAGTYRTEGTADVSPNQQAGTPWNRSSAPKRLELDRARGTVRLSWSEQGKLHVETYRLGPVRMEPVQ